MFIRKKQIKEKSERINDALVEGARDVEFKGHKQTDLDAKLAALETKEQMRAALRAQMNLLDDQIADEYLELDEMCVDIRKGVEGHKDFGDDSALYGAMGFVRRSERASGLTHKAKKSGGEVK